MKNALILLNREEKNFGHVLNGLCHISFGMGYKIALGKFPNFAVRFASKNEIYQFRQKAHDLYLKNKQRVFYSDFVSAMNSVKPLAEHMDFIKSIKEKDHVYLGVCICADAKITEQLMSDFNSASALKNYNPYIAQNKDNQFDFVNDVPPNSRIPEVRKKMVMSLHPKESLNVLLNSMIKAAIEVGRQIPMPDLHFMPCIDGDNNEHFNISLHPFPILMANSLAKQNEIVAQFKQPGQGFINYISVDEKQNPLAICGYGEFNAISGVFSKERCGLWRKGVTDKDLTQDLTAFPKLDEVSSEETKKLSGEIPDAKKNSLASNSTSFLPLPKKNPVTDNSFMKLKKTIDKIDSSSKKLSPEENEIHQKELNDISIEYNQKLEQIHQKMKDSIGKEKKEHKYETNLFKSEPKFEITDATRQALVLAKKLVAQQGLESDRETLGELTLAFEQDRFRRTHNEKLQFMVLRLQSDNLRNNKIIDQYSVHASSATSLTSL